MTMTTDNRQEQLEEAFARLREFIEGQRSRIIELSAELGEANAEIDRHHRDFKRIVQELDCWDADGGHFPSDYLVRIRNIVG